MERRENYKQNVIERANHTHKNQSTVTKADYQLDWFNLFWTLKFDKELSFLGAYTDNELWSCYRLFTAYPISNGRMIYKEKGEEKKGPLSIGNLLFKFYSKLRRKWKKRISARVDWSTALYRTRERNGYRRGSAEGFRKRQRTSFLSTLSLVLSKGLSQRRRLLPTSCRLRV